MARNQQVTHIPNTTSLSRFRKSGRRSNMAVFIACTPANCARIVKSNDRLRLYCVCLLLLCVTRDSMLARRGFSRYPLSLFISLPPPSLPFFDAVRLNYPSTLESEEEEERHRGGLDALRVWKTKGPFFFLFFFFSSPFSILRLARLPFHALSFEGEKGEETRTSRKVWISVGRQTITLSMIYEPRGGRDGGRERERRDAKVTRHDRPGLLGSSTFSPHSSSFDGYRDWRSGSTSHLNSAFLAGSVRRKIFFPPPPLLARLPTRRPRNKAVL